MVAKRLAGMRSNYCRDLAQVPTEYLRGKIRRFRRQRELEREIFSSLRNYEDQNFVL